MTKIAFLGLGAMGRRMAARLIDAGHDVTLWNRTPDRAEGLSAPVAATPAEAAHGAGIVISMVTDDDAARDVWLGEAGALAAMAQGALAVESSTVTPGWISSLAEAAEAKGISLLDAPVAGSRPQAEAGELVFLAGGTAEDVARFDPVARAMGKAVIHAGPQGKGAVFKLMVNALLGVQAAAMAEILAYGAANGIPEPRGAELLGPLPVTSPAAAGLGKMIANKAYDPMFTIDLIVKDLGYLIDGSQNSPVMARVRETFAEAAERGHGGSHISAVGA